MVDRFEFRGLADTRENYGHKMLLAGCLVNLVKSGELCLELHQMRLDGLAWLMLDVLDACVYVCEYRCSARRMKFLYVIPCCDEALVVAVVDQRCVFVVEKTGHVQHCLHVVRGIFAREIGG